MEASNPYDETPVEVSFGDAFKEEAGEKGSGNLNAFILYSYPTTFLVVNALNSISNLPRLSLPKRQELNQDFL